MKSLITSLFAATAMSLSLGAFAKTITLYEQPNENSKQVGMVDIAKGVVPIFTQQDGTWIKVGDPQNGNVGWIKANDMSGEPGSTVTFTQRFIDNGKGTPQSYRFISYGPQSQMSSQEQQQMMRNLQIQQQEMQRASQQMFNNFHQVDIMSNPMYMPVVYVPVPVGPVVVRPVNNKIHPTNAAPVSKPSKPSSHVGAIRTSNGAIKTN